MRGGLQEVFNHRLSGIKARLRAWTREGIRDAWGLRGLKQESEWEGVVARRGQVLCPVHKGCKKPTVSPCPCLGYSLIADVKQTELWYREDYESCQTTAQTMGAPEAVETTVIREIPWSSRAWAGSDWKRRWAARTACGAWEGRVALAMVQEAGDKGPVNAWSDRQRRRAGEEVHLRPGCTEASMPS